MRKIVFATNNLNKLAEVRQMLPDFEVVGLHDLGFIEKIPETAHTFKGNAILKADYITEKFGLDCFADDSGLEVEALDGAPGIYSARYAGEPVDHNKNIDKLLDALKDKTNRQAQFKTVIALNFKGDKHYFSGIVKGEILYKRQGEGGFGYDPIFKPEGYKCSFAEMTTGEKGKISHRGKAVEQLIEFLKNY